MAVSLGMGVPSAALAREQTQTTYKIAVDNPNKVGPAGHDFEYVDFFPRDNVRVHASDVLDFNWNTGAVDGAHTVSFLTPGQTPPSLFAPDTDDANQLEFNPTVFGRSDASCGTATRPCLYDGSTFVNSGFTPNAPGADFYVKLDPKLLHGDNSAVVNYVCLIHPGMTGSVTLVSDRLPASRLDTVEARADAQFVADTAGALGVEQRDTLKTVALNADGRTHTTTVVAGTATQYVEVVEMLPGTIKIKPGDTINWVTNTIKDPHTITFPEGSGSNGVDPLDPVCEGAVDKPVAGLDPTLCGNRALFEVHVNPQPQPQQQGVTSITSSNSVGTSGIIGNSPGIPNHFSFSFPNAGTFQYQCRIHDNMVGTVIVQS
jgi:plastocyanin